MLRRLAKWLLLLMPIVIVAGVVLYLQDRGLPQPGLDQPVVVREGGEHWLDVTVQDTTQLTNVAFIRQESGERTGEGTTGPGYPARCPVVPGERITIFAYGTEGAATKQVVAGTGIQPIKLTLDGGKQITVYVTDEHNHKLANLKLDIEEQLGYGLEITTNRSGYATFYLPDEATAIRVYPWGGNSDPAFREFTTASQLAARETYVPIGDGSMRFKFALK
jgi:hypothetical protein